MVRAVLAEVCGPQEAQHGMVWAEVERTLVFCMDDGRIAVRDHIWVQDTLMVTILMLKRVGLDTNIEKTKSLVCTPGSIWGKRSKEAYKRRVTGEGETFRERKRSRVSCADCGATIASLSLKGHI